MKIGFIGLGHMGTAMAANLIRAGHDVTVFNRTPGRAGALIELGVRVAANLAETCEGEVVITMLANDDAAYDITLGEGGTIAHLRKGAIHLSMSTISVALSQHLAQAHAQVGQRYVAAPVFGRPDMAAAAKLFIVAAGEPAAVDACRPLFEALGQKTSTIGVEPSAANLSTIFTSPAYKIFGPLIATGTFGPAAFAAPLASLLHDRFLRLFAQGGEKLDWSAIGGLATQNAGQHQVKSLMSSAI